VDEQRERDGALDSAAGAVAGLAGAQDVAGVGEGLLDGPAGRVPLDQRGGAGGQVGADQGEQAGVAAGEDDPDGAGVQAAVPQAGDVGQAHVLVTAVDPDRGGDPAGGGQLAGGAQPVALAAGPAPGAGRGGARSYGTALARSRQVQVTAGGRCLIAGPW
jgi:hypothetical protein